MRDCPQILKPTRDSRQQLSRDADHADHCDDDDVAYEAALFMICASRFRFSQSGEE